MITGEKQADLVFRPVIHAPMAGSKCSDRIAATRPDQLAKHAIDEKSKSEFVAVFSTIKKRTKGEATTWCRVAL